MTDQSDLAQAVAAAREAAIEECEAYANKLEETGSHLAAIAARECARRIRSLHRAPPPAETEPEFDRIAYNMSYLRLTRELVVEHDRLMAMKMSDWPEALRRFALPAGCGDEIAVKVADWLRMEHRRTTGELREQCRSALAALGGNTPK